MCVCVCVLVSFFSIVIIADHKGICVSSQNVMEKTESKFNALLDSKKHQNIFIYFAYNLTNLFCSLFDANGKTDVKTGKH